MENTPQLKAAIVDDEPHGVKMLVNFLLNYCDDVSVVATASSAEEARNLLPAAQPDVLFLDINMPSESGFDLLQSLGSRPAAVVFVTAYQEYAIKAIKAGALDYLLKPVDIDELRACIEKVRKELHNNSLPPAERNKQLGLVMNNLNNNSGQIAKLAIPTGNGFEFVLVDEVVRCESDNTYTTFYLRDGKKHLVCKPIKEYEEVLEGSGFMRVHRSHLVNLEHVRQIHRTDGWHLITADNARIEIARRRVDDVLQRLKVG